MTLLLAVQDKDNINAGPIGLVIVLVLLLVTFLLIRNMNARIKRLPREFPERTDEPDRE